MSECLKKLPRKIESRIGEKQHEDESGRRQNPPLLGVINTIMGGHTIS